ncbi:MAG: hypothetical protein CTY16_00870 [Methylobacter sp.]|nr:MAG: hypothetical protein CTY16_00870 [Methylobacter sp.]
MSWGKSKITFIQEGHLKGGRIRNPPDYIGDIDRIRNRAILLIHGFNSNENEAETLYTLFRENISRHDHGIRKINDQIIEVFWPGDTHLPIIGSLGRELAYSKKIKVAKECGNLLSKDFFVDKLKRNNLSNMEIILIAHSLGCRLILESLRYLSLQNQHRKIKIVLMAAAVPKKFVKCGGRLYDPTKLVTSSFVMYSDTDDVLRYSFPAGQALAGEPGEAIGLTGDPRYTWNKKLTMNNFGHGDYWKKDDTAKNIANWLGAPILPSMLLRQLHTRQIANNRVLNFFDKHLISRKKSSS